MTSSCHAHLDRHRYDMACREVPFDDAKIFFGARLIVRSVRATGMILVDSNCKNGN